MNPSTAYVTETRPEKRDNVDVKIVTPVTEESSRQLIDRQDISATLECTSIFDFQQNDSTQLYSEYQGLEDENEYLHDAENIELFNPIENANEQRITLLARKFADKDMSPEEAARLEILTQRFRNVMPAITEKDVEIMENFSKQLERGLELSERLHKKYK